ncbi:TadE/TadG family type IV pilus assembly protein [Devosia sp.]|uniref:TadE/TadG family type IV pilus assembly protein n=1 Tax=Devosia sp. TaxID=1871048 RepID=UPI0032633444
MRRFWANKEAVAAVEFALLLPLLMILYSVVFETGRGWLSYRKFYNTVEAAARYAARYPEFEGRVRANVPAVVLDLIKPLNTANLNLTLFSTIVDSGIAKLTFAPYNFYGNASTADYRTAVAKGHYREGETVIVVAGTYSYQPISFFSVLGSINFHLEYTINPFFSRTYIYQAGTSDWNQYNVP